VSHLDLAARGPRATIRVMFGREQPHANDDFPNDFRIQRIGVTHAMAVSELPPTEIAKYFREHPEVADRLLSESCDKRFSPSSFISEEGVGFSVGWYSSGYMCVRKFSNLADAATDYLLFSLGKGRWNDPTNST
jgi:hypothetical protein